MDEYPHPSTGRMIGRGLRRRCPLCGAGGLFRNWVQPHSSCPRCQLKLDRGENDFFLGSYTLNFIVAELVIVVFLVASVAVTWPDVPWNALLWVGAPLVVLAPIAFYPLSRLVWLAIDLTLRPPRPSDFPGPGDESGRRRVS